MQIINVCIVYKSACPVSVIDRTALQLRPAQLARATNRTLVVPYRDPWTRLLSGYRSKMYGTGPGACSAKEVNADQAAKCFQGSWMPWFSLDKSQNLLSRYLDAATQSGHEDDINEHFLTQSRQCLASAALKQARLRVVPAPLEEPRALNAISDAVAPDRPFVEAVHGAYMHPDMNDASLSQPEPGWLRGAVRRVLWRG